MHYSYTLALVFDHWLRDPLTLDPQIKEFVYARHQEKGEDGGNDETTYCGPCKRSRSFGAFAQLHRDWHKACDCSQGSHQNWPHPYPGRFDRGAPQLLSL